MLVSVLLHAAVFSIPLSMKAKHVSNEIEVFLIKDNASSVSPLGGGGGQGSGSRAGLRGLPGSARQHVARKEGRTQEHVDDRAVDKKPAVQSQAEEPHAGQQTARVPDDGAVVKGIFLGDPGTGVVVPGHAGIGGGAGTGSGTGSGGSGSGGAGTGGGRGGGTGTGIGPGSGRGPGLVDAEFGRPDGPRFIHRETPEYPFVARKLGKEGRVVLMITIDEKGNLLKVEVMEASDQMFAGAAVEAIKKSKFLPAKKKGTPVPSRAILPIKFSLRE